MQPLTPKVYSDHKQFHDVLAELAEFRDPSNKTAQRIVCAANPSAQYIVKLRARPGFWQRICEFFYKPKHLRLNEVIGKVVRFFRENESLIDEEGLNLIRTFQSKISTIHNVHKKVKSSILQNLNQFISTVDLNLNNRMVSNQQKELDKLKEARKTYNRKTADLYKQQIVEMRKLGDELERIASNGFDEFVNHQFSFEFPIESHLSDLWRSIDTHDCKITDGKESVTFHSVLFPEFFKDPNKFLTLNNNTQFKYQIWKKDLFPTSTFLDIKKFIKLVYGGDLELKFTIKDLLICWIFADKFDREDLTDYLLYFLQKNFFQEPSGILAATWLYADMNLDKAYFADAMIEPLNEIPERSYPALGKNAYEKIAKFLEKEAQKKEKHSKVAQKIIAKWKKLTPI